MPEAALLEDEVEKGDSLKRTGIRSSARMTLWKTYVMGDQTINAASGVDIEIHRGEYAGDYGSFRIGSKSTLMNLIRRLDSPYKKASISSMAGWFSSDDGR